MSTGAEVQLNQNRPSSSQNDVFFNRGVEKQREKLDAVCHEDDHKAAKRYITNHSDL